MVKKQCEESLLLLQSYSAAQIIINATMLLDSQAVYFQLV
jgi:hypothetical protein